MIKHLKNIFSKKILLTAVGFFLILLVTIIACKKDEQNNNFSKKSNKLKQFYNSSLIESFKKEFIAKEFLREINNTPIKVINGILSFNSVEDYNIIYELLVSYTNKCDELIENDANYLRYADTEEMPEDIILYLFESLLNFNSLRMDIEEQLITLERGPGISDDNDPDDHYTLSPFQRALLSSDCEVIVDDLICVFYDNYYIGIMNYDWTALRELHQFQRRNNFDKAKALEFCSGNPNAFFLTEGSDPTVSADFTYTVNPKKSNVVQFENHSYSETYKDMSYLWDFGDGITSIEKNPKHTFRSIEAENTVTLTVSLNNKAVQGSTVGIILPPKFDPSIPYFIYSEGNKGLVAFTCTHPNPTGILGYEWNFGDGSAPKILGYGANTTNHTYAKNGTYNVKLTVQYSDGTGSVTRAIQVVKHETSGGSCCKGNSKEIEKERKYVHNGNTRRIKQVMKVTNNYLAHRIYARTRHQQQNSTGTWYAKKVDKINVGYEGTVYWTSSSSSGCGTPQNLYWWESVRKNSSVRRVDNGAGLGNWFQVTKKSLWSRHYVEDDGIVRINGTGDAAVHDETCN
ncbi:MAG: PKD domain-containing protein [Bacteroidales bacterium]|jgi:PKD repeat protein|nr:PKD domain-containing protein [Bacteroidales bacterium]